jgi:hypothetical protein
MPAMKWFMAVLLSIVIGVAGCKTHQPQQTSIFRQPSWWERRMDRLETWEMRHGYPITKTKQAILYTTVAVGISTLVVGGFVYGGGPALEYFLNQGLEFELGGSN